MQKVAENPRTVKVIASSAPAKALHILLVEDHADTALALSRLLQRTGHTVSVAGSMAEAVKHGDAVDLLICDIGLPDGDGLDLLRQLREQHRRQGLQGICLSGHDSEEHLRQSLDAGFSAHLSKPVDLLKLESAIAQIAQNR